MRNIFQDRWQEAVEMALDAPGLRIAHYAVVPRAALMHLAEYLCDCGITHTVTYPANRITFANGSMIDFPNPGDRQRGAYYNMHVQ